MDGLSLSVAWHESTDGSWDLFPSDQSRVTGEAVQAELHALSRCLAEAGRCGVWRNELITVWAQEGAAFGRRLGCIERGTARVLGLQTEAVHLIGHTADGKVWVQQRSFTKPNDPGKWDTLVGGLVGDGETLDETLARECDEEAGLSLGRLQAWRWAGQLDSSHPTPDAGGRGYLVERLHWAVAEIPDGVEPSNRDGEVQAFALMTPEELFHGIANDQFAGDAALLLLDWLEQAAPPSTGLRT